ncbi:FAD-dependent monooxygenase [Mycobacterium kubicae]|nr:FAD-dependent monooxygenase [Mycobacterium kubicae]
MEADVSRGVAVVLGAGMGGLLAARVLADFYDIVLMVERDSLPVEPVPRRGVPQDRQPHALTMRSTQILAELFPGILDQLLAAGAMVWNDGDLSRLRMAVGGHQFVDWGTIPDPASVAIYCVSRPLLEWTLRQRVHQLTNVEIIDGHDVVGLTATSDRHQVTGVLIAESGRGGHARTLRADLVVDATGRGSRAPTFLEGLGYARPAEEELVVHTAYSTMPVRTPPGAMREMIVNLVPHPGCATSFVMFGCENGVYLVGACTVSGGQLPAKASELLDFANELAPPHALAAARAGDPVADVSTYRFASSRWRRYDKVARLPAGLLVFGDAICSVNPIYGQGITLATIEAIVLRRCLQRYPDDVPRRFFRASAKEIRKAWQTATGSDLALPQVKGRPPLITRINNAYLDRVLLATEIDRTVVQQFLRVISSMDPPSRLLRPSIIARVVYAHCRRRRAHNDASSQRMVPAQAHFVDSRFRD